MSLDVRERAPMSSTRYSADRPVRRQRRRHHAGDRPSEKDVVVVDALRERRPPLSAPATIKRSRRVASPECCRSIIRKVAGGAGVTSRQSRSGSLSRWHGGHVLWLANDMDMGGMDMTGFRMIPAGMGIVYRQPRHGKPSSSPTIRHVGDDDGRDDRALSGPHDSHARARRWTRKGRRQTVRRDRLVRRRLFFRLDRLFACSNLVQWTIERAALLDSRMANTSNVLGGIC